MIHTKIDVKNAEHSIEHEMVLIVSYLQSHVMFKKRTENKKFILVSDR